MKVQVHLEPRFSVYAWYMPGIYHIYVDVLHIHGIYMVYFWIYHVFPSDWINMVYPWIYHVYPPSIYMIYPWIYMVIIWCIYMVYIWYIVVYPWIFWAFWNQISRPARAAGLIQCAHACGWSRVFYSTRHHGNCARGKGCPQKAQPDCRQRSPPVAGGGGECHWWQQLRRRCRVRLSFFLVL